MAMPQTHDCTGYKSLGWGQLLLDFKYYTVNSVDVKMLNTKYLSILISSTKSPSYNPIFYSSNYDIVSQILYNQVQKKGPICDKTKEWGSESIFHIFPCPGNDQN